MSKKISFIHEPNNHGPFDIIGDVHGCAIELEELLQKLGWEVNHEGNYDHKDLKRKVIFVGDLVDRGPDTPRVLEIAIQLLENQKAYWVMGNHDDKLRRYLLDNPVKIAHGLQETIDQLALCSSSFRQKILEILESLPSYGIFDQDQLIVAHAGLKEKYHFQHTESAHRFALIGQPTGEYNEKGYPIRYAWENDYEGKATIVFGHVAVDQVQNINNCIDIDTGCVFGGSLSALSWPEQKITQVKSQTQWESKK